MTLYYVTFTRKMRVIRLHYTLAGATLQKMDIIQDLGVLLCSDLSFIPHIDNISKISKGGGLHQENMQ